MKILSLSILIAVLATIGAALNLPTDEASVSENQPAALPVTIVSPEAVEYVEQNRLLSGIVTAARRTKLAFDRTDRLIELKVDDGDEVVAKQILACIDDRQIQHMIAETQANLAQQAAVLREIENGAREETIAAMQANRDAFKADAELATATLKRFEDLFQRNATSAQQLDERRKQTAAAIARQQAADKELQELKSGNRVEKIDAQRAVLQAIDARLRQLQTDFADSKLTAPFGGTIVKRMADEGDLVGPQNPILELIESSRMEARIGVPSHMIAAIKDADYQILITAEAKFHAQLHRVLPEVDPVTRTQTVIVKIPQDYANQFADGQLVKLQIRQRQPLAGFRLPIAALAPSSRGLWSAYAVQQKSDRLILEKRTIEVLHTDGQSAIVRGTLSTNDQIVNAGVHRVVPGQEVVIATPGTKPNERR